MEISWRIRMNKHSSAMIHGHSALKKLTKILHVVVPHSSPCIGEETTIRCFIRECSTDPTIKLVQGAYA